MDKQRFELGLAQRKATLGAEYVEKNLAAADEFTLPFQEAMTEWLTAVTDPAGADFIPVAERIAVFDNDGTSWCERPDFAASQFQVSLARTMADQGKVDGEAMPFKAWFANDRQALREYGFGKA